MAPSAPARRVSYVIPPPAQSVPRLAIPRVGADRHGSTTPLFLYSNSVNRTQSQGEDESSTAGAATVEFGVHLHPKHRLGITSFALDATTRLSGKDGPEGILYSGGRDGQILAHELGVGMTKRQKAYGAAAGRKSWEAMTGWADQDEEEIKEEGSILFENAWEIDSSKEPSMNVSFRQSVQSHSDWINDILLCNYNRTVISCSSDETVRAWNPHDAEDADDTVVLGRHMDYVQCLAHAKTQNWVASGGFDRTIKLWDFSRDHQDPIVTFNPPEESNTKASVYSIATDRAGSFIASGSPEKVVRLWDPRSGKRTGKLVGHTENIRNILVSDDGRYLLSASADASIKLWSLSASNRCIHTFSHHTDSIWSLHSSHPSLSVFYSGDRSGHVCRVDAEGAASLSEAECVLLCKQTPSADSLGTEGITSLTVLNDQYAWTATSSSSMYCWKVPGLRSTRISDLAASPGEMLDSDPAGGASMTPAEFANAVSPFGFSMDSMQPSALRSRHRDSYNTDSATIPRSESPISTIDTQFGRARANIAAKRESLSNVNPSSSSVQTMPAGQAPLPPTTMFGVPYQSLIKLSSPAEGFTSPLYNRARDPDVSTLYSAASIKSVPIPMRQLTIRSQSEPLRSLALATQGSQSTNPALHRSMASTDGAATIITPGQRNTMFSTEDIDDRDAARIAYENREIAAEAHPICERPEHVVQGTEGIVRSVMLNNRWHALTVDTMGHVGVWDIVRGICIGMFEKADVERANDSEPHKDGEKWKWSPREALEVVRERIEGEAVVHAWCTVDSSIGILMVHIESNRAFDAEIFADEAGYHGEYKFEDDHRLNIGKWVLGNLFAPLVVQEKNIQSEPGYFVEQSTAEAPEAPPGLTRAGISRQGGPRHINLASRKVRSIAQIAATQRTPGPISTSGIVPMTPAVLPDLPFDAMEKVAAATGQSPKPGSTKEKAATGLDNTPSVGSPTPKVPLRSQTIDDSSNGGHADYFSVRRRGSTGADESTNANAQHGEDVASPGAGTTLSPLTPNVVGVPPASSLRFMGKLKAFGKQKKVGPNTEPSNVANTASTTETETTIVAKPATPTLFEALMSKPLSLPAFQDVPPVDVNPITGIIISQASSEAASGWAPVYRGLYSTQSELEDIDILEQELPDWILEFLLNNKIAGVIGGGGPASNQKFNFMVVPWKGDSSKEELPELLGSQSRLTANRFLRVRKILSYVKDKVDLIEKTEKQKDAESQLTREGEPKLPVTSEDPNQAPAPGSPRSPSRSSNDVGPTVHLHRKSSRQTASPPTLPGALPPSSHSHRPRATSSSSSTRSAAHHHGNNAGARHRKASRGTLDDQKPKRPEDLYELLCHEQLLPNDMTLAAVKQFRWKGSGELVMEYRKKRD